MNKIIEKHSLWVRIFHWVNGPVLFLMIWSGLMIYWANPAYPGFFPKNFFTSLGLNQRLGEGMAWHFAAGWVFVINATLYLIFFFGTRHHLEILPNPNSMKQLVPTILHDLGLSKIAPPKEKFNAAQRVAYSSAIFLGLLEITSGFAVYKPVQLAWLTWIFGGYEGARLVHFFSMIALIGFTFIHVAQVARAGWNNFRAMVAGFEIDGESGEK